MTRIPKPMGRPPTPPQLRIADGTHRDDRHGSKEAIGLEKLIDTVPPITDKTKRAEYKKRWKSYSKLMIDVGILTARDLPLLEQLCDAHQALIDALKELGGPENHYSNTKQGFVRHPALATSERLRKDIVGIQQLLGFGPRARASVPPVQSLLNTSKKSDSVGKPPRESRG